MRTCVSRHVYRNKCRHVCIHLYGSVIDTPISKCVGMCFDMHMRIGADRRGGKHADVRAGMCIPACAQTCVYVCVRYVTWRALFLRSRCWECGDTYADMCTNVCTVVCVYGHVCGHVAGSGGEKCRLLGVWTGVCVDMCAWTCCSNASRQTRRGKHVAATSPHAGMHADMPVGVCIGAYVDVRADRVYTGRRAARSWWQPGLDLVLQDVRPDLGSQVMGADFGLKQWWGTVRILQHKAVATTECCGLQVLQYSSAL